MSIINYLKKQQLPFGIIPYSECKVLKPHLIEKAELKPETAIIFLAPYYSGVSEVGNVSLYAAARDYHIFFAECFKKINAELEKIMPDNKFFGFADHSPIDEVDAAAKAGLGVVGDNGLLINPIYGSYVFIGEIITDLSFSEAYRSENPGISECLHCGMCKKSCPKSKKCLSAITQTKDTLSEEEAKLIIKKRTAWGCDICQSVCPMNKNPKPTDIAFFKEELILDLTSKEIRNMSDEDFQKRAYSWRGKNCILRNLELIEGYKE